MARGSRKLRMTAELRRSAVRYRPISMLGRGGMAEVWRAEADLEGQTHPVAIKRLLPELAQNPLYQSMFHDEARLGVLLRHSNIVRVYDLRDVGETWVMIMELVEGVTLKDVLDRAHLRGACMPLGIALYILEKLARALDYAHLATDARGTPLGIVHHDVSPHNIMLAVDGGVKLSDFGLANARVHATTRSQDLVGGKLRYLAPETVEQKPSDHRVDLFAAGIVLWEMLAGRPLFSGQDDVEIVRDLLACDIAPLGRLNPSVPPALERLCQRLLERRPERRLSSARELLEELEVICSHISPPTAEKDIALVVGFHRAVAARDHEPASTADLSRLMRELRVFWASDSHAPPADLNASRDLADLILRGTRPPS